MSDAFIGEIRIVAFGFAPRDWALCDGSSLSVRQNPGLFRVIGKTFGGDGVNTFNVPNLQERVALGAGNGPARSPRKIADTGGTTAETITVATMAAHAHTFLGDIFDVSSLATPAPDRVFAQSAGASAFQPREVALQPMANDVISTVWPNGGRPHGNVQPYLAMNFCISLAGE